jgi:hypothetical protein
MIISLYYVNVAELIIFIYLLLYFTILGFELRASHLLGRHCTTSAIPPAHFSVLIIFEIGFWELAAWAGLRL